jgi:hypothetical protein
MADLKMRPRFTVDVACDAASVVRALRDRIADAEPPLEGYFNDAHCVLRVPAPRRLFFSPELDLTFERIDEPGPAPGGIRVRGLFAPRPSIWTGFVFAYSALAVAGLAGALYGIVQLSLGHTPWALLVPLGALALIGAVYGSTFIGQGLAATQMYEMRSYLDDCLEHAEERARARPRTPLDSARL